jgi:hypothetical protein
MAVRVTQFWVIMPEISSVFRQAFAASPTSWR